MSRNNLFYVLDVLLSYSLVPRSLAWSGGLGTRLVVILRFMCIYILYMKKMHSKVLWCCSSTCTQLIFFFLHIFHRSCYFN